MPVGSKFYTVWSCTGCSYQESTVQAPVRIEPLPGVMKSKIEERWCYNCQGIRRCFLGEGFDFTVPEQTALSKYLDKVNNPELLREKIRTLKQTHKFNPVYWFSPDYEEVKELEKKLQEMLDHKNMLQTRTDEAREFYARNPAKPRCLDCSSHEVSALSWENDKHSCGGKFKQEHSDTRFSTKSYAFIQYDELGNATKSVVDF
ncbi:hypothetical protein MASR2M44_21360 [Bacteroidota bacterium]